MLRCLQKPIGSIAKTIEVMRPFFFAHKSLVSTCDGKVIIKEWVMQWYFVTSCNYSFKPLFSTASVECEVLTMTFFASAKFA